MRLAKLVRVSAGSFIILLLSVFLFAPNIFAARKYEIPVLLYHHILPEADNKLFLNDSVITPEKFAEHMNYLSYMGYETITTDELYDFLKGKKELSGKKVLITFDDGYASNYKYAYEILKKHNFTATVFVLTGRLYGDPDEDDPDKLTMLSEEAMASSGDVFEFGSHSHNMHFMNSDGRGYLLDNAKEEIVADTETSFSYPYIKKLYSYPFGHYDNKIISTLKSFGCKMAFTTRTASVTKNSDIYMLPRYTIPGSMKTADFKQFLEKTNN